MSQSGTPSLFARPAHALVCHLLGEANLPAADLTERHMEHFFGCGRNEAPRGVVGLELHGDAALLRSLVVDPQSRGRGCATALVARAEHHAREHGAHCVYLLTTTAADFFARLGYKRLARERAPDSIRATSEFSSLCPVSSVLMMKELRMEAVKDASHLYEVEHRATHAARPGFRISELKISSRQKVPWHYHNNVADTFYVLEGAIRIFCSSRRRRCGSPSGRRTRCRPGARTSS